MINKPNLTQDSIWSTDKDVELIKNKGLVVNIRNNYHVKQLRNDFDITCFEYLSIKEWAILDILYSHHHVLILEKYYYSNIGRHTFPTYNRKKIIELIKILLDLYYLDDKDRDSRREQLLDKFNWFRAITCANNYRRKISEKDIKHCLDFDRTINKLVDKGLVYYQDYLFSQKLFKSKRKYTLSAIGMIYVIRKLMAKKDCKSFYNYLNFSSFDYI